MTLQTLPGPSAPVPVVGPRCFYCRRRTLLVDGPDPRACTRDHIYPRSWVRQTIGPQSERWHVLNRVWCCAGCNTAKGDALPMTWLVTLSPATADRLLHRLALLEAAREQTC